MNCYTSGIILGLFLSNGGAIDRWKDHSQFDFRKIGWWDSQTFHVVSSDQPLSFAWGFKPAELEVEWLTICYTFGYITRTSHIHSTRQQCNLIPAVKRYQVVQFSTSPMHVCGDISIHWCCCDILTVEEQVAILKWNHRFQDPVEGLKSSTD